MSKYASLPSERSRSCISLAMVRKMIAADGTSQPIPSLVPAKLNGCRPQPQSSSAKPVKVRFPFDLSCPCLRRRTRCTVFIAEITSRAFIIADSNKRRTLSRADIAKALSKSDQFDFLIDIVPREEPPGGVAQGVGAAGRPQKKGPPGTLTAVSACINPVHRHAYRRPGKTTQNREEGQSGALEGVEGNPEGVPTVDLEQVWAT